jgi:hypothetical protein
MHPTNRRTTPVGAPTEQSDATLPLSMQRESCCSPEARALAANRDDRIRVPDDAELATALASDDPLVRLASLVP